MNMAKVEQLRDDVIGLKPVYSDIGNSTEVLLKNGEVVKDRRVIKSVVKALAASYAVDLKAQRRLLQEKLRRQGILPFYLGKGRVFVPLKMRQAISGNDSVYGYVDLAYMGEPQEGPGKQCQINLSNGILLKVLSSQSTVLGGVHTAMAVLTIFQPDNGENSNQEQVMEAGRTLTKALANMVCQLDRIEKSLK